MTFTFPTFSLAALIPLRRGRALPQRFPRPARALDPDEDRQTRAILLEMMTSRSECSQSETELMQLMARHPG